MPLYLDEVQTVPGWEGLVRRLIDTGGVEVFVSGSSARLLSREVATGLRGRAMEALIHPFSFREALRHAAADPSGRSSSSRRWSARHSTSDCEPTWLPGGFPRHRGQSRGIARRGSAAMWTSWCCAT
jgi:predicted AAA+ superfamily ATPase